MSTLILYFLLSSCIYGCEPRFGLQCSVKVGSLGLCLFACCFFFFFFVFCSSKQENWNMWMPFILCVHVWCDHAKWVHRDRAIGSKGTSSWRIEQTIRNPGKKQKKLLPLFYCILKTVFANSNSFWLITSRLCLCGSSEFVGKRQKKHWQKVEIV